MDLKEIAGLREAYASVYENVEDIDEANRAEKEYKLNDAEKLAARNTSSEYFRFNNKDPQSPNRIRAKGALHKADQEKRREKHEEKRGVKESYDLYDLVLEYLLDQGFCESVENAETMMAHMSEQWVDSIIEAANQSMYDKIEEVHGLGGHVNPRTGNYDNELNPQLKRSPGKAPGPSGMARTPLEKAGVKEKTVRETDPKRANRIKRGVSAMNRPEVKYAQGLAKGKAKGRREMRNSDDVD
jgi:hypothetical protein